MLFGATSGELIEATEGQFSDIDPQVLQDVRNELAYRKTRKAVKLAKVLNCETKRRLSNEEEVAKWGAVPPMEGSADPFDAKELDEVAPF